MDTNEYYEVVENWTHCVFGRFISRNAADYCARIISARYNKKYYVEKRQFDDYYWQ